MRLLPLLRSPAEYLSTVSQNSTLTTLSSSSWNLAAFLHDSSTTIDKTTGTPAHTVQKLGLILDNQLLCGAHMAAKSWSCRFALHKSCQIRHFLTMYTDQLKLQGWASAISFSWNCQHLFFCTLQSMGSSLKMDGYSCFENHTGLWRDHIDSGSEEVAHWMKSESLRWNNLKENGGSSCAKVASFVKFNGWRIVPKYCLLSEMDRNKAACHHQHKMQLKQRFYN